MGTCRCEGRGVGRRSGMAELRMKIHRVLGLADKLFGCGNVGAFSASDTAPS